MTVLSACPESGGTGCWSHLATRAAVSLQVFDELWSGSVSNSNQWCTAIGQPGTVQSETQRNQLQQASTGSVGQSACHTPAYLVLGARPWGMTGLRQGMDMMLMLRYRPWLVVQDSSPSAITERKNEGVDEILYCKIKITALNLSEHVAKKHSPDAESWSWSCSCSLSRRDEMFLSK